MTADGSTGRGAPGDAGHHREDGGPRGEETIPLGQKLYDSPFLLLVTGVVIMLISFTGWGLWEILSLPPAPLP